jgi:dienelactone hydrolase
MTTVILFHSSLGLGPGVVDSAERLRALGHEVVTPDTYDGFLAATIQDGIAARDRIGRPRLLDRVGRAIEAAPVSAVLAGFSLGAALAHEVALTARPEAKLLLFAGAADESIPNELTIQFHAMDHDPYVSSPAEIEQWAQRQRRLGSTVKVHLYPGAGHLFTDASMPDYDEAAAELLWDRVAEFLSKP